MVVQTRRVRAGVGAMLRFEEQVGLRRMESSQEGVCSG